jgi:hypothetical protein
VWSLSESLAQKESSGHGQSQCGSESSFKKGKRKVVEANKLRNKRGGEREKYLL